MTGRQNTARKGNTLYCFSPLVMITTFTIEIVFAIYTLWRYKWNEVTRLVVLLLVFLATFQLAEYMVCEGSFGGVSWSRIGFVAITMLPPLGVHLIYALAGAKKRRLLGPAYGTAAAFTAFFIGLNTAFSGHECVGNYVIFQVSSGLGGAFAAYYYGWLAVGVVLAWHFVRIIRKANIKRALTGLTLGYAAFIIPTATANVISPDTVRGIPSIMCGFAVILAIVLVTLVLPNAGERRKRS